MGVKKANGLWLVAALVAGIVLAVVCWWRPRGLAERQDRTMPAPVTKVRQNADDLDKVWKTADGDGKVSTGEKRPVGKSASTIGVLPMVDEPTVEASEAAEEERLVKAFDDLTDKWIRPVASGVSMKDVENFVAQFKKVPAKRRDECLHRALNLVPDANVMVLVGMLMDKTLDEATVKTVFNDMLNRDEDVKEPILKQIFQDRTHKCWADVAWILDVTGKLPGKKR